MNAKQRRALLAERVAGHGELSFTEASALYGVSEMTIRRDVEELEAQGVARRIPGGVISTQGRGYEPPFESRVMTQAESKAGIGSAAADLLVPGSSVILDPGSTALAVANAIRGRDLGLRVVTSSLPVALALVDDPGTRLLLTGGELRPGELSLAGPEALESVNTYNVDTFVMGVAGLSIDRGATDYNRDEAAKKRASINRSTNVIACIDALKLGRVYLAHVSRLAEIDVIVTDAAEDHPVLQAAMVAGCRVITVPGPARLSPPADPQRHEEEDS